ncbi:hypothetical protein [Nocardioides sp. B-3]|uniref:hypothetical protein n=1 Tax=Nocardioides sp. B-3 TaxID=2895565 RepID=UPI00215328F2|nr:hypothetical protein [Nocardioides sp. B-3]UUZ59559.1 hypothetical protein LP418_28000 [Nocardioides sp. B-3]
MVVKTGILPALPLVLICPLMLVVLGMGNASIEAVRAACTTTANAGTGAAVGSGADLGVMPVNIAATPGGPVDGEVVIANANIKLSAGATPGIVAIASAAPDFITLNEVGDVPLPQMEAAAPGYRAYREPSADNTEGGVSQSLNNVIMWRTDTGPARRWPGQDRGQRPGVHSRPSVSVGSLRHPVCVQSWRRRGRVGDRHPPHDECV